MLRVDAVITAWASQWRDEGLFGEVEHRDEPDDRGHYHWLIRLRGEEKDVVTLWLSLRQRRVHVETEVMAAPEVNVEAVYRFAMVKNADLGLVHLALGPEDGIYLVGALAYAELDVERLDELVGETLTCVDEVYPTMMTMAHPGLYRRRPRRTPTAPPGDAETTL
jgi:hypothetical protein